MLIIVAVDGKTQPESRTEWYVAHRVRPGTHTLKIRFDAVSQQDDKMYLATKDQFVYITATLRAGRSYIVEADVNEVDSLVKFRVVDVGGTEVPEECLVLNHPTPPSVCSTFPWFGR